jgi:hypothetical protein
MTDLGSTTLTAAPRVAENEHNRPSGEPCLSTAELAECTCPEACERDHDID